MASSSLQSQEYVLYLGGYYDERLVTERGLPTRNAAGSNRMQRLTTALRAAGQRVLLISPAVTMRMRWRGRLLHPAQVRNSGGIPVLFCAAIGLPVLGMLCELLMLWLAVLSVGRRRRVRAVMVYNYSPAQLLVVAWVRLFWRVPVILNLEDIYAFRMDDWRPGAEARPIQQLILGFCFRGMKRLAQGVIIPTRRFAAALPPALPRLVVSGCLRVSEARTAATLAGAGQPLRILYAGNIEFEHGIHHFLGALRRLHAAGLLPARITAAICGGGVKADWLRDELATTPLPGVAYHGFVSDVEYARLLADADVCVGLQDPAGRDAQLKTPSKVYEFLGHGRVVVATEIGDLPLLPPEVITLTPWTADGIADTLRGIADAPSDYADKGICALAYAREQFEAAVVGRRLRSFVLDPAQKLHPSAHPRQRSIS